MDEVKIRSGTRVKLKHVDPDDLPTAFLERLRKFAHADERILAVWFFAIQAETKAEQPSVAIAVKSGSLFARKDDAFLQIVDEVQMMLPEDLAVNIYRFGSSELLARYCLENVEPLYLRSSAWLDKQRKKLST